MAEPIPASPPLGDYSHDDGADTGAGSEEMRENEKEEDEVVKFSALRDEPQPIQRINKEKSNSLECLLERRATADQLLQQNIMHGSMFYTAFS